MAYARGLEVVHTEQQARQQGGMSPIFIISARGKKLKGSGRLFGKISTARKVRVAGKKTSEGGGPWFPLPLKKRRLTEQTSYLDKRDGGGRITGAKPKKATFFLIRVPKEPNRGRWQPSIMKRKTLKKKEDLLKKRLRRLPCTIGRGRAHPKLQRG